MIQLTRLNQVPFYLNPDLIEHIETTPDTVITLTTGQKYLVRETTDEVVARIVAYRRRIWPDAFSARPATGRHPTAHHDEPDSRESAPRCADGQE